MPTAFKRKVANAISALTVLYTVPANTEAIIVNISLCNLHTSSNNVTVDIDVNGTIITWLDNRLLAVDETYDWDGSKIMIYESGVGDILKITPTNTMDVHVSIVEET